MLEASALALAESLTVEERDLGLIYPHVERIREITMHVAARVMKAAQVDGVASNEKITGFSAEKLLAYAKTKSWSSSLLT